MSNESRVNVVFFSGFVALFLAMAAPVPLDAQEHGPLAPGKEQPAKPAAAAAKPDSATRPAFRIDQPGTMTFTVGMVIKGKIEKPQVIIFLPKEKSYYRELKFTHSFADDIAEPLPFVPVLE